MSRDPFGEAREGSRAPPGGGANTSADVRELIEDACDRATLALITTVPQGLVQRAKFRSIVEDELILELYASTPELELMSLCCITFGDGGKTFACLTSVMEFEAGVAPILRVRVPSQAVSIDARLSPRVPAPTELGVEVLLDDGAVIDSRARNISMSGILLEFAQDADPVLDVGDELSLTIRYHEHQVFLRGIVRRRVENAYGIFFPAAMQRGRIEPPPELRAILFRLEQIWMQNRPAP